MLSNLCSKNYQGPVRAVTVILVLISYALTSPQIIDLGWQWVTTVLIIVAAVQQALTRFTSLGDNPG